MAVLTTSADPASETARANRAGLEALLAEHEVQLDRARLGGGERYLTRHRARGKLTARERIELLLDEGSPYLECSPLAAWGSEFHVGGAMVTGIGVVEGVECVVIAQDPTVRGGSMNPYTLKKNLRALEIARVNRLPLINLVESGGADLPTQADLFVPAGQIFRDLTELSAMGIPTIALVFGNSTAGGAYVPGMCDYSVLVDQRGEGVPRRSSAGEDGDRRGVRRRVARRRGDALARVGALRLLRAGRGRLHPHRPRDRARPQLEEARPTAGAGTRAALRRRRAARHRLGRPTGAVRSARGDRSHRGRLASSTSTRRCTAPASSPAGPRSTATASASSRTHSGVLFMDEAKKASEFILLANQTDTPLLFLQNTTGYMVGQDYEQAGIIKDGAKMINAVTNSTVPHLTVIMGSSYGAGNYGMCGRAYRPRFLFAWPNSKMAVMGPQQLAGVLSIVARQSAESSGQPFDDEADAEQRARVEEQIERESHAFFNSGKLYDDGVIDPRDTRTVLGIALSAVHSNVVEGRRGFGVFRM